jgi:hypothetical protein
MIQVLHLSINVCSLHDVFNDSCFLKILILEKVLISCHVLLVNDQVKGLLVFIFLDLLEELHKSLELLIIFLNTIDYELLRWLLLIFVFVTFLPFGSFFVILLVDINEGGQSIDLPEMPLDEEVLEFSVIVFLIGRKVEELLGHQVVSDFISDCFPIFVASV